MTDVLNRTVYARMFNGTLTTEADSGPWGLVGAIYDRVKMPALVLAPGKQVYYDFKLDSGESATLPLPASYTTGARLYIALQCEYSVTITLVSPTHGSNSILTLGTNTSVRGHHPGIWCWQGDVTSMAVAESAAQTSLIQVFMYEIPDLSDVESYYDQQIGLGHT